jgi:hypothetical protein
MTRREEVASRMAEAVIRRLVSRKLADIKDEARARDIIRRILTEDLQAEEKLDADARALLQGHAKEIKDSASDYRRLFALVKAKLARERGFTL